MTKRKRTPKPKPLWKRAAEYGENWRHSVMDKVGIAKFAYLAGYRAGAKSRRKGK